MTTRRGFFGVSFAGIFGGKDAITSVIKGRIHDADKQVITQMAQNLYADTGKSNGIQGLQGLTAAEPSYEEIRERYLDYKKQLNGTEEDEDDNENYKHNLRVGVSKRNINGLKSVSKVYKAIMRNKDYARIVREREKNELRRQFERFKDYWVKKYPVLKFLG